MLLNVNNIQNNMKIEAITRYEGRWCAWLEDGRAMVSDGSMELLLCEPVNEVMKVVRCGIVAGKMIAEWGGLSAFSGKASEVVGKYYQEPEM